jgi:hypothetical protein
MLELKRRLFVLIRVLLTDLSASDRSCWTGTDGVKRELFAIEIFPSNARFLVMLPVDNGFR